MEVDTRYIKGMLANPDIQPSASINWWIVSIMTFHFELVHVKGTFYGPDGLSHRTRQPDDSDDEEDDDFEDWIDQLHGFVHMINNVQLSARTAETASNYVSILATAQISSEEEEDSYDIVPWSENAKSDDLKLLAVRKWHKDWKRPSELSDRE